MAKGEVEVAVVGLGIMGSCTLWRLAASGVSALGFDQHSPPHAFGSSHGHSRIVRRIQFEGDAYVPLAEAAYGLWAKLEAENGRPLLTRTGLLVIGPPESQLIRGGRESALRLGLRHQILDTAALRAGHPQHRIAEGDIALLDPEAGFVSPEEAITAALAGAEAGGAGVERDCAVLGFEQVSGGVELETTRGRVRARHLVVATGTWLGRLVPALASTITIERHFFGFLEVADPAAFAPDRFPIWIRENPASVGNSIEVSHGHTDRILAFGFPTQDGRRVKVGFPAGAVLVSSPEVDPKPWPAEQAVFDDCRIDQALAGLAAGVTDFTACLYDNSPDFDFIVGPSPGMPSVTVLGGFSGHGFKHAPAIGEIAACLATGRLPPVSIDRFSPGRFSS